MAQYIPVHTTTRKKCEALHYNNRECSYMELHEACITKDCGYVLKVSTYDKKNGGKSLERYYREWYNEAKVFGKLNKLQEQLDLVFFPKLYDRWFCNKKEKVHFYLLMEKYDGDLSHLVDSMTDRNVIISMALER